MRAHVQRVKCYENFVPELAASDKIADAVRALHCAISAHATCRPVLCAMVTARASCCRFECFTSWLILPCNLMLLNAYRSARICARVKGVKWPKFSILDHRPRGTEGASRQNFSSGGKSYTHATRLRTFYVSRCRWPKMAHRRKHPLGASRTCLECL